MAAALCAIPFQNAPILPALYVPNSTTERLAGCTKNQHRALQPQNASTRRMAAVAKALVEEGVKVAKALVEEEEANGAKPAKPAKAVERVIVEILSVEEMRPIARLHPTSRN